MPDLAATRRRRALLRRRPTIRRRRAPPRPALLDVGAQRRAAHHVDRPVDGCCDRRRRPRRTPTPGTPTSPGYVASMLHGVPHVVTTHSLEPLAAVEGRAARRRLRAVLVLRADGASRPPPPSSPSRPAWCRRRAALLPGGRPGAVHGDPQRHRHRGVRADHEPLGAGAIRRRPEPAVRALPRPDHPAEGPALPARRSRASLDPDAQLVLSPARPTRRRSAPRSRAASLTLQELRDGVVWIRR